MGLCPRPRFILFARTKRTEPRKMRPGYRVLNGSSVDLRGVNLNSLYSNIN